MSRFDVQPRIIECSDCTQPYMTKRSNTKRCEVCRMLNNLEYIQKAIRKPLKCDHCKRAFLPMEKWTRGDYRLCGKCDHIPIAKRVTGTCAFCKQESDMLVHRDIPLCLECGRSTSKRNVVMLALSNKQRQGREAPDPEIAQRVQADYDVAMVEWDAGAPQREYKHEKWVQQNIQENL